MVPDLSCVADCMPDCRFAPDLSIVSESPKLLALFQGPMQRSHAT